MFSPTHFLDMFNELLMLMPVFPLFAVMAWLNRKQATAGEKTGRGEATGWFATTAEWHFSILILVPCFLYLFLFKPEIGMARDWDLFTIVLLGLVPVALMILNRFFRETKMQAPAASFTVPAVATCVALSVLWIGINASPTRSAQRFERILVYDKTHAAYAYENLAIFYHDRGMLDKATEIMEATCELSNNPRQWVRLGMYYEEQGNREKAVELMRRTVEEHPGSNRARMYLIALLEADPNVEEMWALARDGIKHHPNEAIYWFYYGQESIQKGMTEEGVAALQKCLTLNPPERARQHCIELIQKHGGQQK
jgi:cytochrome c-type biogenesis protein CcmH/NrfG